MGDRIPVTAGAYEATLEKIPGVKRASLEVVTPGNIKITLKFDFWTNVLPWRRKRVLVEAWEMLHRNRPFNVSFSLVWKR